MKRTIRKGISIVPITYTTGNYSNNLVGSDFCLDSNGSTLRLIIDFSKNLRSRIKGNAYHDACELLEDYSHLETICIDEQKIIDDLSFAHTQTKNRAWEIQLIVGDRTLNFGAVPCPKNMSLYFNIETYLNA